MWKLNKSQRAKRKIICFLFIYFCKAQRTTVNNNLYLTNLEIESMFFLIIRRFPMK